MVRISSAWSIERLDIEHLDNRTLSNTATFEHKTNFIWFQTRRQISYWLQFQTGEFKEVPEGAEEPITYFLPTNNINLAYLFYFDVRKNILLFALLLFILQHCNVKSVACIASAAQHFLQTPLAVLIDIYFEVMSR